MRLSSEGSARLVRAGARAVAPWLGSDLCADEKEDAERGLAAAAEAICQQRHALVAVVAAFDVKRM